MQKCRKREKFVVNKMQNYKVKIAAAIAGAAVVGTAALFLTSMAPTVPRDGEITMRRGVEDAGERYVEFIDRRTADKRPAAYSGDLIFVDLQNNGSGIDGYLSIIIGKRMPLEDISSAPEAIKKIALHVADDY